MNDNQTVSYGRFKPIDATDPGHRLLADTINAGRADSIIVIYRSERSRLGGYFRRRRRCLARSGPVTRWPEPSRRGQRRSIG